MVVNDVDKFAFVVESAASIAEIICRYAIFEAVYLTDSSAATNELRKSLVQFYAAILIYLSKVRAYFDQNTACKLIGSLVWNKVLITLVVRILKSGLLGKSDIESYFNTIISTQEIVDRCSSMVGMQGTLFWFLQTFLTSVESINQHMDLKRLLKCIDGPIERISAGLDSVKDGLECMS